MMAGTAGPVTLASVFAEGFSVTVVLSCVATMLKIVFAMRVRNLADRVKSGLSGAM